MEFWPADQRPQRAHRKATSKQEDEHARKFSAPGPLLTPGGGTLAAATLRTNSSRLYTQDSSLEWDFIARRYASFKVVRRGILLFPDHRSEDPVKSALSTHRKAEEGARFLRQRYPDADIPFEMIKEHLQDDLTEQIRSETDPISSNCLATVYSHDVKTTNRRVAFAYPMGPLWNELNLSISSWSRNQGATFDPNPTPVATFDTPICQIVASNANHSGWHLLQEPPTLAVRTMSFCALFSVRLGSSSETRHLPLSVERLAVAKPNDTGTVVDIAASPFSFGQMITINDIGELKTIRLDDHGVNILPLRMSKTDSSSKFWKVTWTRDETSALIASSDTLRVLDFRGEDTQVGLRFGSSEHVTAIEGSLVSRDAEENRICVTTDKRVIWLDDRYPSRPLLSWEHMRTQDLTLRASTCWLGSRPVTFLTSLRNGLISAYQASTSRGLLHTDPQPQVLYTVPGNFRRRGDVFYRHPASIATEFNFVELSTEGGLYSTEIMEVDDDLEESVGARGFQKGAYSGGIMPQWNKEVKRLASMKNNPKGEENHLSLRESFEVNFEGVYQVSDASSTDVDMAALEAVDDLLDRMPRVWQEADYPLDNFMTAYDIAFISSSESGRAARSEFLAGTPLDGKQHGSSLLRKLLNPTINSISEESTWSLDLSPIIQKLHGPLPQIGHPAHSESSNRSTQEMEIDLLLHENIYAGPLLANSFKALSPGDESLETAIESMSILDHPEVPNISFTFLKPRPSTANPNISTRPETRQSLPVPFPDAPLAIRHLLSEWEVGTDPKDYRYTPHHHSDVDKTDVEVPETLQNQQIRQIQALALGHEMPSGSIPMNQAMPPFRPIIHPAVLPPKIVSASQLSQVPEPIQSRAHSTQPSQLSKPSQNLVKSQKPVIRSSSPFGNAERSSSPFPQSSSIIQPSQQSNQSQQQLLHGPREVGAGGSQPQSSPIIGHSQPEKGSTSMGKSVSQSKKPKKRIGGF